MKADGRKPGRVFTAAMEFVYAFIREVGHCNEWSQQRNSALLRFAFGLRIAGVRSTLLVPTQCRAKRS